VNIFILYFPKKHFKLFVLYSIDIKFILAI